MCQCLVFWDYGCEVVFFFSPLLVLHLFISVYALLVIFQRSKVRIWLFPLLLKKYQKHKVIQYYNHLKTNDNKQPIRKQFRQLNTGTHSHFRLTYPKYLTTCMVQNTGERMPVWSGSIWSGSTKPGMISKRV